jgi:manganese transport protein
MAENDIPRSPYLVTEETIQDPPTTLLGKSRYLGPGFILSASIVGSGELIATTTLGAEAGFVALWVILLSCLVKVTLQLEFGKHAINTGETTMEAFNRLPGPKWGKANWTIWAWLMLMMVKFLQVGGIIGLVTLTVQVAFPNQFSGESYKVILTLFFAIVVALLIFRGRYKTLEKVSIVLIGLFTLLTIASIVMLQGTEYAIQGGDILSGLKFTLPQAALLAAVGAFGITGVGGDEIMHYPYWLLEKGYAAKTGPRREGDPEWARRAKGWISVMYLDALLAMVVYTVMTACFYMLGAAILSASVNAGGEVPDGIELVGALSTMYTETLGSWAGSLFLAGAFVVLFSTLFSALGAWTRAYADSFGQTGWIDFSNEKQRRKTVAICAWVIPMLWSAVYLFMGKPKSLVIIGGVATSVMLLIVVYAAFHFRYRRLASELKPSKFYDVAFWASAISIFLVGVYSVVKVFK